MNDRRRFDGDGSMDRRSGAIVLDWIGLGWIVCRALFVLFPVVFAEEIVRCLAFLERASIARRPHMTCVFRCGQPRVAPVAKLCRKAVSPGVREICWRWLDPRSLADKLMTWCGLLARVMELLVDAIGGVRGRKSEELALCYRGLFEGAIVRLGRARLFVLYVENKITFFCLPLPQAPTTRKH